MTLVFIDFEASSLWSRSYPIEIGAAWIADDQVVQVADLIRRDPGWAEDWSHESATVHGIHREELARAEAAESIARRYAQILSGRIVISDAPEFDQHWLDRLLRLLPEPPWIKVMDFDQLVHVALSHEGQRAVYRHLTRTRAPHRAGADAARLAAAWHAGLGAIRQ